MTTKERFDIPPSDDERRALTALLSSFADSPTVRRFEITYWCEGTDLPFDRMTYSTARPLLADTVIMLAPAGATRLEVFCYG